MDALTPESELEAAIWRALDRHQATCGDALSFLDSILLAAKAYAASDSEELTALRRGVLRKAQTSPGTRGGASRAATELHPPGSVASDVSGVAGGGATTSTAVSIPGAVPDPFPPAVAKLLDARDEHCQRCGSAGRLERHHRRAKASGGSSARAHTQCACNGVRLCRGCHRHVHEHPAESRKDGWIISQSAAEPSKVAMPPWNAWRSVLWYPTCDGGWSDGTRDGFRMWTVNEQEG